MEESKEIKDEKKLSVILRRRERWSRNVQKRKKKRNTHLPCRAETTSSCCRALWRWSLSRERSQNRRNRQNVLVGSKEARYYGAQSVIHSLQHIKNCWLHCTTSIQCAPPHEAKWSESFCIFVYGCFSWKWFEHLLLMQKDLFYYATLHPCDNADSHAVTTTISKLKSRFICLEWLETEQRSHFFARWRANMTTSCSYRSSFSYFVLAIGKWQSEPPRMREY